MIFQHFTEQQFKDDIYNIDARNLGSHCITPIMVIFFKTTLLYRAIVDI